MKPDISIPPEFDDKRNPFKVPNAYFDQLEDQIMEEVEGSRREKPQVPIRQIIRPYFWIAALFIGTFLIFRGVIRVVSPSSDSISQQFAISSEDLEAISLELDEFAIIEFLNEDTQDNSFSK